MKRVAVITLYLAIVSAAGCASSDQRIDLAYEKAVSATGGSGVLFIARPLEQHQGFQKPSGEQVIGRIQNTDREIITTDSISEWIMLAFVQELYTAGYDIKTVSELPPDVAKGMTITLSEIRANQVFGTLVIRTESSMKLSVGIWKNGKFVKTLNIEGTLEDKGADRSADPVSALVKKNLQNLMQSLVPDIIRTIEES